MKTVTSSVANGKTKSSFIRNQAPWFEARRYLEVSEFSSNRLNVFYSWYQYGYHKCSFYHKTFSNALKTPKQNILEVSR